MSYRLIDSNAIAEKYPEVNDMPCVFADLPNGLDGSFIDVQPVVRCKDCTYRDYILCPLYNLNEDYDYCSLGERKDEANCGARMEGDNAE